MTWGWVYYMHTHAIYTYEKEEGLQTSYFILPANPEMDPEVVMRDIENKGIH